MNEILYGAAYYDEYMPYDRLDRDVEMMKKAGINLVRIAESTWSTLEPEEGVFDFYHIDRMLKTFGEAGIHVIVGTPTYAVPSWMEKKHPDIMVTTRDGRRLYGSRQIMDITNKAYLFYCERVIRKLLEHVKDHPAVVGYQIDNETKHFGTASPEVQRDFLNYLKKKFHNDTEEMNREFGFNYWSNAVHSWEDFPDVRGTINGSLAGEFEKFQRELVTGFLSWQAALVREYKREDQFITHNFDFGWKGGSYGVQPDVNHFHAAECLDIAGCDIYHPSQGKLTGAEAAFGGDLTRSLKGENYFVLETQAQGFPEWTPYDGQLRLLAFSHFASGADLVEYWHWHSLHNACETYWKGLLSHDFAENQTYREAMTVGQELKRLGKSLLHLKKENRIAILVSNESLTGLKLFPVSGGIEYNDVLRWLYDALYEMNYECDFISPECERLSDYKAILMPAFYCAPEDTLLRLKEFVRAGGVLVGTFKSCFTNENVKVYHDTQPHILRECFGASYDQFTAADSVGLSGKYCGAGDNETVRGFMECLRVEGGSAILSYVHDNWGQYAAAVTNRYGEGTGVYLGCMFSKELLKKILRDVLESAGILPNEGSKGFPVIVRKGKNTQGKRIDYIFNYSGGEQEARCPQKECRELLSGKTYRENETILLPRWGVAILEENPCYLFAHFIGEEKDGEQIYFAVSRDGLHWKDLNGGMPVLRSEIGTRGVRDPFLVRDPKSGINYLIATDLRIEAGEGWEKAQEAGSRDLIVWESKDLIHWSSERACTVGIPGAGCVWAPEAVYDREKEAFLVFFASKVKKAGEERGKHRIYAAYTGDFKEFSETFLYFERESHVIDTTILESGGRYYRVSKDETDKKLILEASDSLLGEYTEIESPVLDTLEGVEGPEGYLLPDGKTWCLMADRFQAGTGYLPMLSEDLETGQFRILSPEEYDMGVKKKRHGGIMQITAKEYEALLGFYAGV